jgi:hypothetical protein
MAAISYSIALGQPLEGVVAATNAPSAGSVEIRFDQTVTAVTDASLPSGSRALKKGEIQYLMRILEQKLINDPSVAQ